jgi:hypothetical protein
MVGDVNKNQVVPEPGFDLTDSCEMWPWPRVSKVLCSERIQVTVNA